MITHTLNASRATLDIKVKGDILSTNAEAMAHAFGEALRAYERETWTRVEVDLMSAKMVDSTGLNVLLGLIKAAKERQAQITLRISSPTVQRVFQFSRIDLMAEVLFKEKRKRTTR